MTGQHRADGSLPTSRATFAATVPYRGRPVLFSVGSLFSGIGGMDLGLERAGMEVVWQCEIDPYRRRVLEKHWPNAVRYEDVRSIGSDGFYHESYRQGRCGGNPVAENVTEPYVGNGREGQYVAPRLDSVDLICGGFPCQDLSVAGRRAGLSGSRSGLFYEFARIVGEVRPEWLLVENVPGLLSSNGGDDFRIVIDTFQGFGYGLSWRILDSRYFGVPQRRRRVYIVGSLGDLRSAAVLFEPQSGGGDSQAGRETGQEVAAPLGASTSSYSGRRNDLDHESYIPEVTGSLDSTLGHHGWSIPNQSFDQNFLQVVALQGAGSTSQGSQGSGWKENESFTLNKTDVHGVATASTVRRLTPTECERLQALPDGWSDLGGTKDGPRYAACGDAVTSTVAEWIGRRVIASPAPGQPSIVSSPHPRRKGLPHLIGDRAGDGPRDGGGVSPGQQPPPSLNKEPADATNVSRFFFPALSQAVLADIFLRRWSGPNGSCLIGPTPEEAGINNEMNLFASPRTGVLHLAPVGSLA